MRDIQVVVPISIFADADGTISFTQLQETTNMAERITVLQDGINRLSAEMRDVGKQLETIIEEMDGMEKAKAMRTAIGVLKAFKSPLETN